jgi:asparagine synthase (glutamine-hydrolysing)
MCGVAGAVGPNAEHKSAWMEQALQHRGPDSHGFWRKRDMALVHTRLSIMDPDRRSDCPYQTGDTTLVWNGELWNHEALRGLLEVEEWRTTGDTETAARWLDAFGVVRLDDLEGMFALAWEQDGEVYLARDRFGEIPLHLAPVGRSDKIEANEIADGWAFASEVKALLAAGADPLQVRWVEPGTYVKLRKLPTGRWLAEPHRWYDAPVKPWSGAGLDAEGQRTVAAVKLRDRIGDATVERGVHADVPVCTLLSGGIDSSAVAYHLKEVVPNLVAYTAVLDPKGVDLRRAREVADHLEIELREVPVPTPSGADLEDVVRRIEMPFKAQVEIGWSCLHLARAIEAGGFKVCFSGEGADELWASYGFTYHAMKRSDFDWHEYRKALFVGQHRKNFARCNKIFMAHGVECRLPFLHTPLVEFGLSLPFHAVADGLNPARATRFEPAENRQRGVPKAIMRRAYAGLLPASVLERKKLAFQDGNGTKAAITASLAGEGVANAKSFYLRAYKEAYA